MPKGIYILDGQGYIKCFTSIYYYVEAALLNGSSYMEEIKVSRCQIIKISYFFFCLLSKGELQHWSKFKNVFLRPEKKVSRRNVFLIKRDVIH